MQNFPETTSLVRITTHCMTLVLNLPENTTHFHLTKNTHYILYTTIQCSSNNSTLTVPLLLPQWSLAAPAAAGQSLGRQTKAPVA